MAAWGVLGTFGPLLGYGDTLAGPSGPGNGGTGMTFTCNLAPEKTAGGCNAFPDLRAV
jgi:hypothetical protein